MISFSSVPWLLRGAVQHGIVAVTRRFPGDEGIEMGGPVGKKMTCRKHNTRHERRAARYFGVECCRLVPQRILDGKTWDIVRSVEADVQLDG